MKSNYFCAEARSVGEDLFECGLESASATDHDSTPASRITERSLPRRGKQASARRQILANRHSRRHLIVTIDGPAGSGKSSTAKALAKRIKAPYIDTGAMYRALTLKAMKEGARFEDKRALVGLLKKAKIELIGSDPFKQRIQLDGKDVTTEIRSPELTKNVFHVAQEPVIRREMVKKQRRMGLNNGAVMEGRDIGTKVFPDADYKFYFEANDQIRAKRRYRELIAAGQNISLTDVLRDQKKRDSTDYNRKEGPLKVAKDAIIIDTSSLTIDETVDRILAIIKSRQDRKKRGQLSRVS